MTAKVLAGQDIPLWPLLVLLVPLLVWLSRRTKEEAHNRTTPRIVRIGASLATATSWGLAAPTSWQARRTDGSERMPAQRRRDDA
jgi:hypothetical protein